jgi:hypothetical protein
MGRKPKATVRIGYGMCRACCDMRPLTNTYRIRPHRGPDGKTCPGSGKSPRPPLEKGRGHR